MYNPSYISLFSKVLRETMYQLDKYPHQISDPRNILLSELTTIPENQKSLARSVFDSWSDERGNNCDKFSFILRLATLIDVNIIQSDIEVNAPSPNELSDWDADKFVTSDLLLHLTEKMVDNSIKVGLSSAEEVIQKNLTLVMIEFDSFVTNMDLKRIIQNCLVQLEDALNLEEAFNLILWLNKESKTYGLHDNETVFIRSFERQWDIANLGVNRVILINILTSRMINCLNTWLDGSTASLAVKMEKSGNERWTRLAIRCLNLAGSKIQGGLDPRRIIYSILNENCIENKYNFTMAIEFLECHSKILDGTKKFNNNDVIKFAKFLDLIKA